MADSIYNVPEHNVNKTYAKNAIVFKKESIGNSGVPLNLKYYYALKDVPTGQSIGTTQYWGGYITIKGEKKPHFLWTPSYNLSVTHSPRINTVMFGNGYEQRSPDGIYSSLIRLDVSFDMRNQAEASAILHFLKTRKGTESFIVKNLPPIYADSFYKKRFVCPTFNSNFTFHNNYTMKGTFVETNN